MIAPVPNSTLAVSNSRNVIELQGGYSADAYAAAIAFLWTNWEVVFSLEPGLVRVKRTSENSWRGAGLGGHADWYLLKASYSVDQGQFECFSWGRFAGVSFKGLSKFEYKRLNDRTIVYWGSGWGELPILLRPVRWFPEALANQLAMHLNRIGGKVAERISQNPGILQNLGDPDLAEKFQEMVAEEVAIRSGARKAQYFTMAPLEETSNPAERDRFARLREDLDTLENNSSQKLPNLFVDLHKAIAVFQADPNMGLAKLRSILEYIVEHVYSSEFREEPNEITLSKRVRRLYSEHARVPFNITSMMKTVVELGNLGVHPNRAGSAPSLIDYGEFRTGFDALLAVTGWYLIDYIPKTEHSRRD